MPSKCSPYMGAVVPRSVVMVTILSELILHVRIPFYLLTVMRQADQLSWVRLMTVHGQFQGRLSGAV